MTKKPPAPTEARDLRALLETVVGALTLPHDLHDYDPRILRRAGLVRVLIREALADGPELLDWNLDYLRKQLAQEETEAAERAKNKCGRCRQTFDPTDTAFDGHARHKDSPWCRWCVDRCHESTDAFHACPICDPARYGGEPR